MMPFYSQANEPSVATQEESSPAAPSEYEFSQERLDKHWYLGIRGGWVNFQDACGTGNTECDSDTSGFGFYGGYQMTPWFALEVGGTDYGSAVAYYEEDKVEADILDAQLSMKLSYDLSQDLDGYLRLGASYQVLDKESSWAKYERKNSWSAVSAVGLNYVLNRNWSIRGEYQFIDGIGDSEVLKADLHFVSLGLTYRFGQKRGRAIKPTPAKIQAPVSKLSPIPVKATVPIAGIKVAPVTQLAEISLSADSLFNSNSSIMASSAQLSELASTAASYDKGTITVIGHTDNKGSERYNQWLSEKRAQSVSDYIESQGVNPSRIIVIGMGELSPIASNATKESRAQNRRVEVKFEESTKTDSAESIEEVLNND
jgi:OOP family OmpA-OmpF porin